MNVEVITATENPIDVISVAAGICYGKDKDDVSEKRIRHCFRANHLSVAEHANITFRIEGISRACMAQLTRHRHASFCVESQRFCKYDFIGDDWFVIPPSLGEEGSLINHFFFLMEQCSKAYRHALVDGVKPEDARYLLPEATKTNLEMTCNLRELFHIFDMRLDKAAQWEIRELAAKMKEQAGAVNEQWEFVIGLYGIWNEQERA